MAGNDLSEQQNKALPYTGVRYTGGSVCDVRKDCGTDGSLSLRHGQAGGIRGAAGRKGNEGFTLIEVLLVAGILLILLTVSVVGVVRHLDYLKITGLDDAARAIYIAAENRVVLLQGSGASADLLGKKEEAASESIVLSGAKAADAVKLAELLPAGSIDPSLRDGYFCILYNASSHHVSEVFYAEKQAIDTDDITLNTFRTNKSDRVSYYRGDKSNRQLVGWYKSDLSDVVETRPLPTPGVDVHIENGNELTLTVTYTLPKDLPAGVAVTAAPGVILDYKDNFGATAQVVLLSDTLYPVNGGRLTQTGSFDTAGAGDVVTYTWVLDSLDYKTTDPAGTEVTVRRRFRDLFAGSSVNLGSDFTAKAELTLSAAGYVDSFYSAGATDNSLFAAGTNTDAKLSNLRHLQNLDVMYSGASGKDNAIQLCDIDCKDYKKNDGTVLVSGYEFIPIENWDLKKYTAVSASASAAPYAIRNLKVTPESASVKKTGNEEKSGSGLFYSVNYDFRFEDVRIVDSSVQGTESKHVGMLVGEAVRAEFVNCRLENVTVAGPDAWSWSHVGGMVGVSGDNINFKDCVVKGLTAKSSGAYTGGLLGSGTSATIENCVIDGKSGTQVNITSPIYAGGLVGNLKKGSIKDCMVLKAEVICSGENSEVGGMIGRTESGLTITSSTADAVTVRGDMSAGGLVGAAINLKITGTAEKPCMAKNVTVRAANLAGGLVGTIKAGSEYNAEIEYCQVYWTSGEGGTALTGPEDYRVVAQTAGGLVGTLSGGGWIKDSFAATLVDGTIYAGGLAGNLPAEASTLIIERSYANCRIRAGSSHVSWSNAGGLVGVKDTNGGIMTLKLKDVYAAGFIDGVGVAMAGGLYGGWGGNTTAENVYVAIHYKNIGNGIWPQAAGMKWSGRTNCYFMDYGGPYILSDALSTVDDEYPDKRSYENMKSISMGTAFEAKSAAGSHPYSLGGAVAGAYPFPGLKNMDHYGDW